ncbi:cupin domain-containing protein [Rivibacter subsaxonicus]|uniref:AraC-like protein n=1 Tax=Rivibacter subsaxonicus TaxID=457575 RepID=A0A4Q7VX40_9BURK|nr:AraC family ligand binding domain-containing protein [Rivibacter subsaxonicus]RZU01075.1 AraC-like protein [Rivibacter subsaxonicus]
MTTAQPGSFEDFAAAARAEGYDEVLVRDWKPLTELPTHTHPFAVKALVVAGEMWLTEGEHTRHLRPGDRFEIEREAPHAERYGSEGTTFWAARRHATDPTRA